MNLQVLDYEEEILRNIADGQPASLETVLLVLSGLNADEKILSYQYKIDDIFSRFINKCNNDIPFDCSKPPPYLHESIAKCLFEYLWNSKPKRFGENFLLADVVDAQLDSDLHRLVGTCVGLTSLYSVLGLRVGLNLSLLVSSDHLLTRLRVGQEAIDIDHTDPQGFDCRTAEGFREFPLVTLIGNVLNSRGLRKERSGEFAAAKGDYHKALLVNPQYANALNNRGNMRFREEDMEGAIADYSEAVRLDPCLCEAYCNRGMALKRLGRYEKAREDFRKAMRSNPEYTDARTCLELLDGTGPEGTLG